MSAFAKCENLKLRVLSEDNQTGKWSPDKMASNMAAPTQMHVDVLTTWSPISTFHLTTGLAGG